jgi:hypothetical protein
MHARPIKLIGIGLVLLLLLPAAAFFVSSNHEQRASAEFWELLRRDRDVAIASIVFIDVAYWPAKPASDATIFLPDPKVYRMQSIDDYAKIFPPGQSPAFVGTVGTIKLSIRTKSGNTATIFMTNDSDLNSLPRISPAFDPASGTDLRTDAAEAILDWIARQ